MTTTIFFLSHRCCLGRLGLLCYPVVNSGPPLALPLVFGVVPILTILILVLAPFSVHECFPCVTQQ